MILPLIFPLHHLFVEGIISLTEFFTHSGFVITLFSWCNLTCSFVLCIFCKLKIKPGDLIRFCFNFLNNTLYFCVLLVTKHCEMGSEIVPLLELLILSSGHRCLIFSLQITPPTFLLMILVVTNNHCLDLLFHCLLENGNFLSIVYEIYRIAPFSILLLALVAFSLCFSQIILSRGLSILLVVLKNQLLPLNFSVVCSFSSFLILL